MSLPEPTTSTSSTTATTPLMNGGQQAQDSSPTSR